MAVSDTAAPSNDCARNSFIRCTYITLRPEKKNNTAELNVQKLGAPISNINFYNAILRIWLGDKSVDRSLEPALLGKAR